MSLHSGAPERPRMIEEEDRPGPPPLMSEEKTKGRGLTILAATLAVAAFAGIVWYAYDQGRRIGSETAAPLIKADTAPTKVRPDSPGGMEVPHQDKLVLDDLGSGRGAQNGESRVERLLPPPETPLPPPEPLSIPTNDATQTAEAPAPSAPAVTPTPAPAPSATAVIPPATKPEATKPVATKPADSATKTLVPPPPAIPATKVETPATAPAPKPAVAKAPKPAPAPAPAPAATGGFNIQVAALRSEDAAAKEWNRVKAANIVLLAALGPTYQRVTTSNGVFFRVQGGPLSENAARDICTALKAKGQACLVVKR
ncbi:SPOR domain-containing protein [Nisaea nitritireducens]|uniref:SPOR domain-containing protein n=1 Tax=Nisaea nitritireducens TaxID=568392 RepID=UPI001867C14B|nr:SPOR domain-containing protein [Nisaea nitritireducens]